MGKYFKLVVCFLGILLWFQLTAFTASKASDFSNLTTDTTFNSLPGTPLDIGTRLELFVDDYLIDRLTGNAELRLHHPEPAGIAIVHDEPWEGSGSGYHSIFFDGEKYRMYYKSWQMIIEPGKSIPENSICCSYALSYDGKHWYKPVLNLYEFQKSKANNIVFIKGLMGGVYADGGHPAVFRDENPDAPADARYKAVLVGTKKRGLFAFKSFDGIHWTPMSQEPIITNGAFDSQNLAFWDSKIGEYRAYWRYFDKDTKDKFYQGIRGIRTAKSKDFINWYDEKDVVYVNSPPEHLYTNVVKPYSRAPHILIGFPERYIDRGWSESMRALPDPEHREMRSKANPRYGTALGEALFMASRDGVLFKRWNEGFLRPGIEREGTWIYGQQSIGWSILETKSDLEGNAPNELSLYALESGWTGTSDVLRRYTLRLDGFVSVYAPMKGGELFTKPLTFTGDTLVINFSSSAAGDIQVEIQDQNGKPIPGYTLADCPEIFGDTIERAVTWTNGSSLSSLRGTPVRLHFALKDADLFSFKFQ
ncbi:MAG: hypothetical protein LLG13_03350 [Bacteroidales bacterium]|nr:hypothetical protein [Bacteroidales bacterium]